MTPTPTPKKINFGVKSVKMMKFIVTMYPLPGHGLDKTKNKSANDDGRVF